MGGLYEDAELYDLVAPPDAAMERFYIEAAGGQGRRVLDLACGSGRFTMPLAASGAIVTGGDLSAVMLARARTVAAERALAIEFIQLDLRQFDLGRTFDAVVIAANSLMHLHTLEDFSRAVASIRRHLAPSGRLVFDVFVPSARLLSLPIGERQLLGRFVHSQMGEVTVEETVAYDPIRQVSRAEWYWSTGTQPDFHQTQLDLRQIYPQELPLLLERGGLKLEARWGDFDGGALTAQSWRQVCIAVAA
jgi:SAM-dependent methyltransferase